MNAITAIAFDYDHDGYVDLFVGTYFQPVDIFKLPAHAFSPRASRPPTTAAASRCFHNNQTARSPT